MTERKVRIGIIGVGNCASSLVQGLTCYREADGNEPVPGLMHVNLGGYRVCDIEVAATFDVASTKVGKDVAEAIYAAPGIAKGGRPGNPGRPWFSWWLLCSRRHPFRS